MVSLQSANWPNVPKKSKEKILNEIKKQAFPVENKSSKRRVTTKELADIMRSR